MDKNIYQGKKILITGASSGIGLEFAKILNKHDCFLILTALDQDYLEKIKMSLINQGKAKIFAFAADLGIVENIKTFYQLLNDKDLIPDILINNVGRQSYGYFYKLNWEEEYEQIILNCVAPIYLIHQIIPHMIQNNFGKILNVGSVAGTLPNPFFAVYGSTKAFINNFSQALNQEMLKKNIQCSCLLPSKTNSKNFWNIPYLVEKVGDISKFSSPQKVARFGLMLLEKNKDYGVYGWDNKIKQFIKRFIPRQLLNILIRRHTHSPLLEN